MGGNGNVGLFLFYIFFPFLLYFLYATTEYGMRRFSSIQNKNFVWTFIGSSISYSVLVWSIVIIKAKKIANELSNKPEFGYDVGLLQPYTNGLFFNFFTFISIVSICLVISSLWAIKNTGDWVSST